MAEGQDEQSISAECANITNLLHSEELMKDISENSCIIDSMFDEDETIETYETVLETKRGLKLDYQQLAVFANNSGFIRKETGFGEEGEERCVWRMHRFNPISGYYYSCDEEFVYDFVINRLLKSGVNITLSPKIKGEFMETVIRLIDEDKELPSSKVFRQYEKYYTDGELLPFKNGIYSTRYNRFLPRTSSKIFSPPINCNFDPSILDNTGYEQYFLDMVCGNRCALEYLFELIGYTLFASEMTIVPTYLVLYGSGSNGKSVVLDLMSRAIGEKNISRISLEQMTEDRFLTQCEGKLANIVIDAGTGYRESAFKSVSKVAGFMKTASDGEPWAFKPLYKDIRNGFACRKFVFASNNYLNFGDSSDGTIRRFHAIPFENTFKDSAKMKNIFDSEECLQWFVMRALVSYLVFVNRAMKGEQYTSGVKKQTGKYLLCEMGGGKKADSIANSNALYDFMKNDLNLDILDVEDVRKALLNMTFEEDFYHDCNNYCIETNRNKISLNKMNADLLKYKVCCRRITQREGINTFKRYVLKEL